MVLVESMFFPPVAVIADLIRNDTIVLERHEHYQKRSFRNRVYLKSSQGKTCFTVPLTKGKNNQRPIVDCTISNDHDWVDQFLRQLQSDYGNAPYYEDYIDEVIDILSIEHSNLYNLNKHSLIWALEKIGQKMPIKDSKMYIKSSEIVDSLDIRGRYQPNTKFFASKGQINYPQVYEEKNGFISGLSILDMLFCCGPESLIYMNSQ